MALAAAAGQTLGKVAYYYVGNGALNVRWMRRNADKPTGKWTVRVAEWRRKAEERPIWAAGLLAMSSLFSVPPLMVVCVLAGTVRMRLDVFAAVTMATRTLRFLAVIYLPGLITGLHRVWPW